MTRRQTARRAMRLYGTPEGDRLARRILARMNESEAIKFLKSYGIKPSDDTGTVAKKYQDAIFEKFIEEYQSLPPVEPGEYDDNAIEAYSKASEWRRSFFLSFVEAATAVGRDVLNRDTGWSIMKKVKKYNPMHDKKRLSKNNIFLSL